MKTVLNNFIGSSQKNVTKLLIVEATFHEKSIRTEDGNLRGLIVLSTGSLVG